MSTLDDLADAYVVGLLDADEAAAVEARIAAPATEADRRLARLVAASQDRFLALDLTAPPAALPADGWSRLSARLGPSTPRPQDAPVPTPMPAPRPARRVEPRATPDRAARRWRLAALGASAAGIAVAAALGLRLAFTETPAVVAILVDDQGRAAAMVEAFDDDSVRVTPLLDVSAGPSQTLQLWTKPDPDGPPVSLGLLETVQRMRISGPDLPGPQAEQLYEITIEPEGGSPTGLPTGPIVGKGLAQSPL